MEKHKIEYTKELARQKEILHLQELEIQKILSSRQKIDFIVDLTIFILIFYCRKLMKISNIRFKRLADVFLLMMMVKSRNILISTGIHSGSNLVRYILYFKNKIISRY